MKTDVSKSRTGSVLIEAGADTIRAPRAPEPLLVALVVRPLIDLEDVERKPRFDRSGTMGVTFRLLAEHCAEILEKEVAAAMVVCQ